MDQPGQRQGVIQRRAFLGMGVASLIAASRTGHAQTARKVPRVGVQRLGALPPSAKEGLRQGLRELGYVEGQSILIQYGSAEQVAELPGVAAALVRLPVDVLVASGTASVLPET
jgi:putative ABC transport system substrate-binding protein